MAKKAFSEREFALARDIDELFDKARVIFAGATPEVVGGTLIALLALWLASHRVASDGEADEKATAHMRDLLLEGVTMAAREAAPLMEKGFAPWKRRP